MDDTPVIEPDHAVDVILRDGLTARLRPPCRADEARLVEFFGGLGQESLHFRFHGFPAIDSKLVDPIVDPDWTRSGAFVATEASPRGERVVAVGNYIRVDQSAVAEVAFAVADEFRSRGLGTRILEQLAARARAEGIGEFVAFVLAGNEAMKRVFQDSGFDVTQNLSGGVFEARLRLDPTAHLEERIESRDHEGVRNSLVPFFRPRAVAVIGASSRRGTVGGELFRNVLRADFDGAVYPVNREGHSVAGVRGYTHVADIPDELDLAVICVPAAAVLEVTHQALSAGVRALCVVSAGFREASAEGYVLEDELLVLVRSHGARLIGPNCLGITSAATRLNATFASSPIPLGSVGFCSQSGALGLALIEEAAGRDLGLSSFVSIGNKADVSSNDLLEYWEDDEATSLILLYLESFGNPRKFGRIARRVARTKPILALHGGASADGARAAGSHTAALAASPAAVQALFRQAGVIQAESLEELIDVAALLTSQPLPAGRGVAILTNAGGLGVLCADACAAAGLTLATLGAATLERLGDLLPAPIVPSNPLDVLGSAPAALYGAAIDPLLDDPGVDSVIVLFAPPVSATSGEVAARLRIALEARPSTAKPVLGVLFDDGSARRELGGSVSVFAFPGSAARALARAAERAEWLAEPAGEISSPADVDLDAAAAVVGRALAEGERWLDPLETHALLSAYGVPLVAQELCSSADEAAAAARRLGFPVVLKTAVAGAHKSESGGVVLGLTTEEEVRAAFARLGGRVLLQPQVQDT
ncbi:MAG: hypothetical protein QOE29_1950, partial [Gaiellaceae bacterium]|nr:hypothetical protein [Gaiellaceae bacterium]